MRVVLNFGACTWLPRSLASHESDTPIVGLLLCYKFFRIALFTLLRLPRSDRKEIRNLVLLGLVHGNR